MSDCSVKGALQEIMNLLIALQKTANRRPNYPSALFAKIMKGRGGFTMGEKNGWQAGGLSDLPALLRVRRGLAGPGYFNRTGMPWRGQIYQLNTPSKTMSTTLGIQP